MYTPADNRMNDRDDMLRFIQQHGFGLFISATNQQPLATHIPFELEENQEGLQVLRTHMSRANPQWKSLNNGDVVLAVFQGAHGYISASWYDHQNVSTWNYLAVQVTGRVRIMEAEELRGLVSRLTQRYEAGSEKPLLVDDLEDEYVRKHLAGIVGLEISIDRLEGKKKLSQNRDQPNYDRIISELEKRMSPGDEELLAHMRAERERLFGKK
jgi:transcriptional regulator